MNKRAWTAMAALIQLIGCHRGTVARDQAQVGSRHECVGWNRVRNWYRFAGLLSSNLDFVDKTGLVRTSRFAKPVSNTPDNIESYNAAPFLSSAVFPNILIIESCDIERTAHVPRYVFFVREKDCAARRIVERRISKLVTSALLFCGRIIVALSSDISENCGADVKCWRMAHVREVNLHGNATAVSSDTLLILRNTGEAEFWDKLYSYPWPLVGLHFVQLSLHDRLLFEEEERAESGDNYRSDIKPEAPRIALSSALPLGFLFFGCHLIIVVYVLKRGDYFIPVGIIGGFPIFALGLSLLLSQKCLSFFESLYSALQICRYEVP
jgi:hypothetical protein